MPIYLTNLLASRDNKDKSRVESNARCAVVYAATPEQAKEWLQNRHAPVEGWAVTITIEEVSPADLRALLKRERAERLAAKQPPVTGPEGTG